MSVSGSHPIGVFDSGVGGLSVLNALVRELPNESFVYFADTGNAPYGERSDAYVADRSRVIARYLVDAHRVKALVVACNTATAAVIHRLREEHAGLPLVGIEPALKPAVAMSRTGHVAVLATRVTLQSRKFGTLHASLAGAAQFSLVACDGLAAAIESADAPQIQTLCQRYMAAAGRFGTGPGEIDTLVLGCTHYPFAEVELRRLAGDAVRFVETGAPVALQTRRLLERAGLLSSASEGSIALIASDMPAALDEAAARWLERRAGPAQRMAPGRTAAT